MDNTNFNLFINLFENFNINNLFMLLLKLSLIIGSLFYIALAVVTVRQITIMKKTLITETNPVITIIGFVHLAAACILLAYFLLIL